MRRTFTLIAVFTIAVAVPVFSQDGSKSGSFWDTAREPAKAAASPAKAGAKAPANSARPTTVAPAKSVVADATAPKSFWDTKPEARAWTGWNSSAGAATTAAPSKASEPAVATVAPERKMAATVTPAVAVTRAVKPRAPFYSASASRKTSKNRGVTLNFPELADQPVVDVASLVPPIENGAPSALGVAVDADLQPPYVVTPPSSVPQPAAPRLPGAAPTKSTATPWLKVTGQYRGRVEDWNSGFSVADSYYLNRLRLQADVSPSNWFRAVVQVQDARTADYSLKVAPAGMYNQLDVRLGFVDVRHKQSGSTFRGGRQEFNFGEGRLVSAGDWGNVGRSFDGGSVQWSRKQGLLTVFAASVVVVDSMGVDELKHGEQFYGGLYTWTVKKTKRVFEPYVFVKAQDRAIDERGQRRRLADYDDGRPRRRPGHEPLRLQRGDGVRRRATTRRTTTARGPCTLVAERPSVAAGGRVSAWTTTRPRATARPRTGTATRSTSCSAPTTRSSAWSTTSRGGTWSTSALVFSATPAKEIKVTSGWHRSWIRDTRDGYYAGAGSKAKTKATTENLFGDTVDIQVAVDLTKHVSVLFGTGYMFAGPYQVLGVGRDNAFHQFFLWKVVF